MLTACLALRADRVLNARSHSSANPNTEIRKPFRDAAGLNGIGKVMHKLVDPYPPLASRADRLLTLQRQCFAIKVCAGVWGVAAAHVLAIRPKEDGESWTIQIAGNAPPTSGDCA